MAKKTTENQNPTISLSEDILDAINKQFKDLPDKVANFGDYMMSDVSEWVSTGSTMLDLAISNRRNGGYPVGRIIEIFGGESTGKSLLAAYAIKNTQQNGGVAVYYDTEYALSREYLTAIGVDLSKVLIVNLESLEDIFLSIEAVVEKVRRSDRKRLVTIVIDSIMGATTKTEIDADYEKQGWNTSKAIILSQAMRKITPIIGREKICMIMINQIRTNLGVTFGDNTTTAGGKAIPFHSSVRIFLKSLGKLEGEINGIKTPVGIKSRATIKKNRLGPPLRSVEYDIYFDRGIDDLSGLLEFSKQIGLVSTSGSWSTLKYVDSETGEEIIKKFQALKGWHELMENSNVKEDIYNIICDNFIMKYNTSQNLDISFNTKDDDI